MMLYVCYISYKYYYVGVMIEEDTESFAYVAINIMRRGIPLCQLPFRVSVPLSAYTEGSVCSLDALHDRMQRLEILPDGK